MVVSRGWGPPTQRRRSCLKVLSACIAVFLLMEVMGMYAPRSARGAFDSRWKLMDLKHRLISQSRTKNALAVEVFIVGDSSALRLFYGALRLASNASCNAAFVQVNRIRYAPSEMKCDIFFAPRTASLRPIRLTFIKALFAVDVPAALRGLAVNGTFPSCALFEINLYSAFRIVYISVGLWDTVRPEIGVHGFSFQNGSSSTDFALESQNFELYLAKHRADMLAALRPLSSSPQVSCKGNAKSVDQRTFILFREVPPLNCSSSRFDNESHACRSGMVALGRIFNAYLWGLLHEQCGKSGVVPETREDDGRWNPTVCLVPDVSTRCTLTDGVHVDALMNSLCYLSVQWTLWKPFVAPSAREDCVALVAESDCATR